jgi:hypothetical protein
LFVCRRLKNFSRAGLFSPDYLSASDLACDQPQMYSVFIKLLLPRSVVGSAARRKRLMRFGDKRELIQKRRVVAVKFIAERFAVVDNRKRHLRRRYRLECQNKRQRARESARRTRVFCFFYESSFFLLA